MVGNQCAILMIKLSVSSLTFRPKHTADFLPNSPFWFFISTIKLRKSFMTAVRAKGGYCIFGCFPGEPLPSAIPIVYLITYCAYKDYRHNPQSPFGIDGIEPINQFQFEQYLGENIIKITVECDNRKSHIVVNDHTVSLSNLFSSQPIDVDPDWLLFSPEEITAEHITDEAECQGIGFRFPAKLDTIALNMQLDIGFGDTIHHSPEESHLPSV